MVGHCVQLDVGAALANVIFEEPASGVKSVTDRDIDILMRMVRRRIAADGDLAAGDLEVDANPKQIALTVARMLTFDDDAA